MSLDLSTLPAPAVTPRERQRDSVAHEVENLYGEDHR